MPNDSAARPLTFHSAVRSEVGLVRKNNEDAAHTRSDLLVLADGMGGHSSGEIASAIAVHTFAEQPERAPEGYSAAAAQTRKTLRSMSNSDETLETMGTTVVAVREFDGSFYVCHIGDSRLYVLKDEAFSQVTTDHTHVQHLVETGRITREQVPTHPYRAMLLKSLDDQPGGSAPDLIPVDLRVGDRVLLCSDGLSDYVPEQVITQALSLTDRDDAADALVSAALRGGTRDNVTVIVADVVSGEPDQDPQFAGAAGEPLSLSSQASAALSKADPGFGGRVHTDGMSEGDTLTPTTVPPGVEPGAEHLPAPALSRLRKNPPTAGIFAAGMVIAIGVAIAFLI